MSDLGIIVTVVVCVAAGHGMAALVRWFRRRARRDSAVNEVFSDPGYSVEVDCRGCGKFNRVPGHRLRDHPKCGQCKARLMPKSRVVLCRVRLMDKTLSKELDAVWTDEDRLWQSLADHVSIDAKAKAEAKNPNLRVVN